jgi:uroporphyrin-III C-methyltransferase/precorrin-2 dehydrogenase/sirohydrochlorin ferrochelatase
MRFLPIFLDLSRGEVVLVGGGSAAVGKLNLLRAAGANVRWFVPGPDVAEELLAASHYAGHIGVTMGEPGDLAGALALVSAAGPDLDERLAVDARAAGILVNVVDRPELSTFVFPAIVDRGDVVVAIGAAGAPCALVQRLRERIEAVLPARIGELAGLMSRGRDRIRQLRRRGVSPRRFWERVLDGPIGAAFLVGRAREAEVALSDAIENAVAPDNIAHGLVHLVGAGPGDADLLTLRALHVLQSADIVLYDDLVGAEILARARHDAELIFVGKRKGEPGIGQDEINRRMVVAAKAGRRVARLKGGDPFVFGRGGEELEHLRREGVTAIVVPGVTAALGCAAEAGLPLTFRQESTRLTLLTANTAEGAEAIDWTGLADRRTTVVVYMGLSSAVAVRAGLIAAGRDPQTPAAVLARGTRPDARTAVGRLDELPALARSVGEGPALLVIGKVVERSDPWRAAQIQQVEVAA